MFSSPCDTTEDYPLGEGVYKLMDKIKAKLFSMDFDVQFEAAKDYMGIRLSYHLQIKILIRLKSVKTIKL